MKSRKPKADSSNPARNRQTEGRLSLQVHLLAECEAGRLDDLECPKCRHHAVSAWFTNPATDVYRTWFICGDCDFHARAQNMEKPRFFSANRVSTDLQERDLFIL